MAFITAIAVVFAAAWLFLHALLRVTQDPREPPALSTTIPFLGPVIGMIREGPRFHLRMRNQFGLPIYTLRLPGKHMYIVNSPALLSPIHRQDATISFIPIIARTTSDAAGLSPAAHDRLVENVEKPDNFVASFSRFTKPALSPGPALDALNRTSAQRLAAGMDKLQARATNEPVILNLYEWIKTEVYTASSDAVYGPRNPLRDAALHTAFNKFEAAIIPLLINPFAKLFYRDHIDQREKLFQALKSYFVSGAHNDPDTSELIKRRVRFSTDNEFSLNDYTRFELGHVGGILGRLAPAVFWFLFHVYSDPQILIDVRREVFQHVSVASTATSGDGNDGEVLYTINLKNIQTSCPILLSTFKETLRVHGNVHSTRVLTSDHLFNDRYLLKKGAILVMPNPVYHSDPSIWGPTVSQFDHRRFLGHRGTGMPLSNCPIATATCVSISMAASRSTGVCATATGTPMNCTSTCPYSQTNPCSCSITKTAKPIHVPNRSPGEVNPRIAYRPFGSGSHICPGRHWATTQALSFIALAVCRFDIPPVPTPSTKTKQQNSGSRSKSQSSQPPAVLEENEWIPPTTQRASQSAGVPRPDVDIQVRVSLRHHHDVSEHGEHSAEARNGSKAQTQMKRKLWRVSC
ncbi:Cytochrome P450 [Rhypophila decipiens]